MASAQKIVRIGGFSAFWGDTPTAATQLVTRGGKLDYLIGDYLAEVTLCILARVKERSQGKGGAGAGGFVSEFVKFVWQPLMQDIMEKGIKVITNAGGMNPAALKVAIEEAAKAADMPVPKVAVVLGDDLTPQAQQLLKEGKFTSFAVEAENEPFWRPKDKVMSCNAYLGAPLIAEALRQGAQIVVTGRGVDSALVLGPLMYEFGWKPDQFDLLSAGSLAGHIIECGAQCTGGNFTDWRDSYAGKEGTVGTQFPVGKGWADVGFPIAECAADGSMVITKPEGTGGLVSVGSVAEQMVYEILDPAAYMLPDVTCDWTQVKIEPTGVQDRIRVSGARGKAPSQYYKVGATTVQGFTMSVMLLISGFDARQKAVAVAEGIINKATAICKARGLPGYTNTLVELLGSEGTYGPRASPAALESREIMVRIGVQHPSQFGIGIFGLEVAPAATSMAPGITGPGGGRPKPTPVIKYHSCLVDKRLVPSYVLVGPDNRRTDLSLPPLASASPANYTPAPAAPVSNSPLSIEDPVLVPLIALCFGRSGDKGDVANIGLICRSPKFVPYVRAGATPQAAKEHLPHLLRGKVTRYELPGVGGFNFVCTRSLGGGGTSSLEIDRQGKAYAQKLLSLMIPVPRALLSDPAFRAPTVTVAKL